MACRSGRVRSSRDSRTGRDNNRRAFQIGRGCRSGRGRRRNRDCHRSRVRRREQANRNPACKDNRDLRAGRAFSNRQICSGHPASGKVRPDCSGPDCKTALRYRGVPSVRRQRASARRRPAS